MHTLFLKFLSEFSKQHKCHFILFCLMQKYLPKEEKPIHALTTVEIQICSKRSRAEVYISDVSEWKYVSSERRLPKMMWVWIRPSWMGSVNEQIFILRCFLKCCLSWINFLKIRKYNHLKIPQWSSNSSINNLQIYVFVSLNSIFVILNSNNFI